MTRAATIPFPALVGLDTAQQALLLLAVEPRLRGLVIGAAAGTGKSSLARGFAEIIRGQAFLSPASDTRSSSPFVELPLGADEESLLGGLDLEATMRTGRRVPRAGILARAHGGLVYVDQLNLLPDVTANLLMAALESGEVRVEREGLSLRTPASFCLIATYDPAEGPPRRHLLDRTGLLVVLPRSTDTRHRFEVVRRNLGYRRSSSHGEGHHAGNSAYADEVDLLRGMLAAARELLPAVRISDEQVEQLTAAAQAFGVEGHRADLFAVRAACAAAALALRETVEPDDLELAVRLVILPRATRIPQPVDPPPEPQEPKHEPQERPPDADDCTDTQPPMPNTQLPEEQVLTALAAELPAELDELPFRAVRRGRTGSRGTTSGTRGRHIRSTPGDPRRRRVDIAATLRAAAAWQRLRKQGPAVRGQEESPRPPAPSPRPLALRADDLRVKHFRSKAGALFCFAVDASGSMALHRMRQAKGAVHTLLQKAYVHRDRVALLAFRGSDAELLLPPSQSVELARRALDLLPTGGGTPLAAALVRTIDVARQARSRGILQTVLVLLTDGRANVPLRGDRSAIEEELRAIGRHIVEAGIQTIVVDTQRNYLSRGEARKVAGWLSGQYVYLPNARGEQIADLVSDSVER
jgi:magnesium chelatase subunit D